MEEKLLFRDVYNPGLVARMAANIQAVYPEFDATSFQQTVNPKLPDLSLTERANLLMEQLYAHLPKDYPTAISILLRAMGQELQGDKLEGLDGFYYLPFCNYVSTYGLAEEQYEVSLHALYELTKRFTAEGAIRPFLRQYTERTLARLHEWVTDENLHVRRLVSEGTRTRLPWSGRLKMFQEDPTPVIALLEKLKTDPELYVRRSVANNLNDIAKDHPDVVIKTLTSWKKVDHPGTQWIISHALRSLIKDGHAEALHLLGYGQQPQVRVQNFRLDVDAIKLGTDFYFHFDVQSQADEPQQLMIDYIVHFVKSNGKRAPKVFKLSKKELLPGETLSFSKKQSFKPITTRKYYPGIHAIQIQVNGQPLDSLEFLVEE